MTRRLTRAAAATGIVATVSLMGTMRAGASGLPQGAPEIVAEVRIHGNYTTPDADVLKIAGLVIGQPLEAGTIREVEARLRKSGRFEDVEIRKRYRSLSSTTDVALIVIVREHPVPDEGPPTPLGSLKRMVGSMQFLPVLNYVDGYGFTYGGRVTFAGALGPDGRVSVPLTWGGTKRAAVELDKSFAGGPFDHVEGGASISSRENPFYHLGDRREELWIGGRRYLGKAVSVGVSAGYAGITLGDLHDRLATYGADVTLDTRADPVFPRNAVFARISWDGLNPRESPNVGRVRVDARGYAALVGQSVLSLRWQYGTAGGSLPPYEKFLLGGAGTLRGYRAGTFQGDSLMAATAEVRVPLTSPLGISRAGISLFTDVGTAYEHGARLRDQRFKVGGGAGVFLLASVFKLNLDVGFREGGHARLHFSTGLQF